MKQKYKFGINKQLHLHIFIAGPNIETKEQGYNMSTFNVKFVKFYDINSIYIYNYKTNVIMTDGKSRPMKFFDSCNINCTLKFLGSVTIYFHK